MDLTPDEREFLRPYLSRKGAGKGWAVAAGMGLLICVAALIVRITGIVPGADIAFVPVFVVGMLVIEAALASRHRQKLSRILRKLDDAARGTAERPHQ